MTYEGYKTFCGITDNRYGRYKQDVERVMPRLLQVDTRVEREASRIYFQENTFQVTPSHDGGEMFKWRCRLWPRHLNRIRKVVLKAWTPESRFSGDDIRRLSFLRGLESLVVPIDEHELLMYALRCDSGINWHDSLELGPQIRLKLLLARGMPQLRSLRNLRHVEFVLFSGKPGSIPGGFLETTIKREIMQPRHM